MAMHAAHRAEANAPGACSARCSAVKETVAARSAWVSAVRLRGRPEPEPERSAQTGLLTILAMHQYDACCAAKAVMALVPLVLLVRKALAPDVLMARAPRAVAQATVARTKVNVASSPPE